MFASFSSTRFRPFDALSALKALLNDPNDTAQVFKIISALSGGSRQRLLARLRQTPVGRRMLRERKALAPVLEDRARLARMPEQSLGRAYLEFCERAGITASGLIAASQQGAANDQFAWDEALVHARMRDAHDLWHVVLGYQTDLLGESCVLAFTLAQTKSPAIGLIVTASFFRELGDKRTRQRLLAQAFARGLRARWFPAVDWEALLESPLADVRRQLHVGAIPSYQPLWPAFVAGAPSPVQTMTARAA